MFLSYFLKLICVQRTLSVCKSNNVYVAHSSPIWIYHDYFSSAGHLGWSQSQYVFHTILGCKSFPYLQKIEYQVQDFFVRGKKHFNILGTYCQFAFQKEDQPTMSSGFFWLSHKCSHVMCTFFLILPVQQVNGTSLFESVFLELLGRLQISS